MNRKPEGMIFDHFKTPTSGRRSRISVLTGSALALPLLVPFASGLAPAPAQAQSAGVSPAQVLEEITVTARRREETLQDTPISVSAFSSQDLKLRNVQDIGQIDEFTPNLTFDTTAPISGSTIASSVFIRGVGQTDFVFTTDPGVGIYLDGIYIARSVGGVLDLLDIERVEVLRGPQGTLFGRNTIGGAINVTTKKPNDEFSGEVEAIYGQFDRTDILATVNVPLTDNLYSRFSGSFRRQDGYAEQILTGEDLGDNDEWTFRGAVRWEPTETITVDISGDVTRGDEQSPASSTVSGSRTASIGAPNTLFAGLLYNNLIGAQENGGVPGTISVPPLPADTPVYDESFLTDSEFTTQGTGPNGSEFDIFGISGTIEWDAGPVTVKSITGYRELDTTFGRDPDGSPLTLVHTENVLEHEQFSEEFQLLGSNFDDRLNWLFGVYYLTEEGTDLTTVPFAQETFDILGQIGGACTLFPGTPTETALPFCPNIFRVDSTGEGTKIDNRSIAVFGEATFDVTERLAITAGIRYTSDRKRVDATGLLIGGAPALADPVAEETFEDVNPRVIVDYQITDTVFGYASFSQGFKSGGFNQRYGAPLPAPTSFEPEEVTSYEVGLKGDFLGDRLRANLSYFHSEYTDIQVVVFDNGIPRTINAAEAAIDGVELESTLLFARNWLAQFSYGYLDARYTELDDAIIGSFGTPIVNPLTTDFKFVNSPEHSLSAALQYERDVLTYGTFLARLDYSYRSEYANDAINTPELIQDGVSLINARVAFTGADDEWTLALFGTNLTDETYITSGVADEPGFGLVERNPAFPRQWGVSLSYRF